MADQQQNDIQVWKDQTPVVNANVDSEFEAWHDQTPDEDRDEGGIQQVRRRVAIF